MIAARHPVRGHRGSSRTPLRAAFAVVLAAGLGACAASTPVAEGPTAAVDTADGALAEAGEAVLVVVNQSNYDVRVFIHYGGQYRRLGLVTSMRTAQFELPAPSLGREVRFLADPVGFRRRQRTDPILLRPGQLVRFGLEKELRSHTLVY